MRPNVYKEYPDRKKVELPREFDGLSMPLGEAITSRRSNRKFSSEPATLQELSTMLYYTNGITQEEYELRSAPSAGARYPTVIYVAARNVDGLDSGLYIYHEKEHALYHLCDEHKTEELVEACLGQAFMGTAAFNLIFTVIPERTKSRYGERGDRYVYLDTGHVGHNVYLIATAMGMGTCGVGAFYDEEVNKLLNRDWMGEELAVDGIRENAIYIFPVGKL